jgi:hypothetical protein
MSVSSVIRKQMNGTMALTGSFWSSANRGPTKRSMRWHTQWLILQHIYALSLQDRIVDLSRAGGGTAATINSR